MALLQFCNQAAVWADHHFLVHQITGVTWEDFSATVMKASIPPNAKTRLKWNSELLRIKRGKCPSALTQCFQVLWKQLKPDAPLSIECHHNSTQFKLESDPELFNTLMEKSGNQPTSWPKEVMEHIFWVDTILHSKKQPMLMTHLIMEGNQKLAGSSISND